MRTACSSTTNSGKATIHPERSCGGLSALEGAGRARYQAELINVLEEDGVHWTITADQDSAVKQIIDRISKSAWVRVSDDVDVAETVHAMKETPKAFPLLVKRTRDRSTPLSGRLVS